jgi:hypothetical protein
MKKQAKGRTARRKRLRPAAVLPFRHQMPPLVEKCMRLQRVKPSAAALVEKIIDDVMAELSRST